MRPRKTLLLWLTVVGLMSATAFAQAPSAQDRATGTRAFVLGPADVIRVWVWKEPDLTVSVMVRPDGKVSLPLVGEVDVAGRTPVDVEQEIKRLLAVYLDAPVNVIVEEINSSQVSVLGEVGAPGRYPLQQQLTVLDVIALAGGFTEYADRDKVVLLRPEGAGVRHIEINLKRLIEDGAEAPLLLRPGDTVYAR